MDSIYFRRNPKNPLEGKEGNVHLPSLSSIQKKLRFQNETEQVGNDGR